MFDRFAAWLAGGPAYGGAAEIFACLPELDTPRLTLRRMTMRDTDDVFAFSSDPEVARHCLWEAHQTRADSRMYLRWIRRQYRLGLPSSWGIVLKETGRLIGTIGFMWYAEDSDSAEVGYSLGRDWWHQGYAAEALRAVLAFGFDRLGLHRIEAQYETDNPDSGRVMAKCGMQPEGVLRGRVKNKGAYHDVALCAILREDPRP